MAIADSDLRIWSLMGLLAQGSLRYGVAENASENLMVLAGRPGKEAVRPRQPGQAEFRAILAEDIQWKPFAAFIPLPLGEVRRIHHAANRNRTTRPRIRQLERRSAESCNLNQDRSHFQRLSEGRRS